MSEMLKRDVELFKREVVNSTHPLRQEGLRGSRGSRLYLKRVLHASPLSESSGAPPLRLLWLGNHFEGLTEVIRCVSD